MDADDIIRLLDLRPHPEGGHYRETFRDSQHADAEGRAASTAIYFLLRAGEISRWHRVDAAETWHWYAGAPLRLSIVEGRLGRDVRLGADLAGGERPQAVVPARAWQQAQSLGAWTLVGSPRHSSSRGSRSLRRTSIVCDSGKSATRNYPRPVAPVPSSRCWRI